MRGLNLKVVAAFETLRKLRAAGNLPLLALRGYDSIVLAARNALVEFASKYREVAWHSQSLGMAWRDLVSAIHSPGDRRQIERRRATAVRHSGRERRHAERRLGHRPCSIS